MVDKCSSLLIWEPLEMVTECYKTSFLLFANAQGAGTLSTARCPPPRTHRATNAQGLPGRMLVAEIDSHIISGILKCGLRTQNVVRYTKVFVIVVFVTSGILPMQIKYFVVTGTSLYRGPTVL